MLIIKIYKLKIISILNTYTKPIIVAKFLDFIST